MSFELIAASAAITLALVFYTVGVFSERHAGSLKLSHVVLFWCGLVFDTTGTTIMTNIAQTSGATGFGIHAVSGLLAIILMLVHAVWATATYARRNVRAEKTFHKFSTFVWLLWLVPYIIGMLVGIPMIHLQTVCAVGTASIIVGIFAFFLLRRRGTVKRA
ncbi:MAG: HsmA family protein [Slackia sp.]|nr:HsmA family protein [Slackia sp.]